MEEVIQKTQQELLEIQLEAARRQLIDSKPFWTKVELLFMAGIGASKYHDVCTLGHEPPWASGGFQKHIMAEAGRQWIADLRTGKFDQAKDTGPNRGYLHTPARMLK